MALNASEQLEVLRRGTTEIIGVEDLVRKLESGKQLRIKLGVDPTARDVTLGWAVVLRKLRDFQRLGHLACLIIGDFTALIGDPTGKSKTRKEVSPEEVHENVHAVEKQLYKILDPKLTEITYNKDWLGKMSFEDVIRLCSRYTVARILERDDFEKRLAENRPLAMHEILYPLCQGMDSVQIHADVELGGNDQKFNNLVGRTLMEQYGLEPQAVMLCPLLVGTDGKEKMSQSLGNYISVVDAPNEMYGKTMSIPDAVTGNYFELATDVPLPEVVKILKGHPMEAKRRLASEIVTLYHGSEAASAASAYFRETFSERKQPVDAEVVNVPATLAIDGIVPVAAMIASLGLAKSNGEARRLMQAGAVSLDGQRISDPAHRARLSEIDGKSLRVGKHRFVTLRVSG